MQPTEEEARLVGPDLIFGAVDEDSAIVVEDYPYGYRVRTSIRYWLETTKNGDRFVSQTLNPKTGRWNKPKKSTYCEVGVMYRNAEGHIKWSGLGIWSDKEWIERFTELCGDHLSLAQRNKLARILGVQEAYKDVKYVIREGPETDAEVEEQKAIQTHINRKVHVETFKAKTELARDFGPIR